MLKKAGRRKSISRQLRSTLYLGGVGGFMAHAKTVNNFAPWCSKKDTLFERRHKSERRDSYRDLVRSLVVKGSACAEALVLCFF